MCLWFFREIIVLRNPAVSSLDMIEICSVGPRHPRLVQSLPLGAFCATLKLKDPSEASLVVPSPPATPTSLPSTVWCFIKTT